LPYGWYHVTMDILSQPQQSPILAEFKHLLQTQWKRRVACQDHCHSPDTHCPDRHFVHVADLEAWWKRTASDTPSQRKFDRLFEEMQLAEHQQLSPDHHRYSTTCLRVLSILLEHDLGHYIRRFYESNMYDIFLERGEGYERLRTSLHKVIPSPADVDQIIKTFHDAKWAYCPLDLALHMDENLQGTKVIVPFCRKVRLGNKGGTASVYWVAVQKDLIHDDLLKDVLKESLIKDPEYGWVSSVYEALPCPF
jgi:hypothetical protein